MRMSKMVGRRIKEDPKDAKTVSHKFLIRGGYIRPVSAGIYSLLPVGKRIVEKIEAIIREEMNRIDGQEVLMPVVLPAELWEESGRYSSVGAELLRFRDRNDKPMLLAMTHEEGIVHLVRTELNSYKQLPVMLYQIQTKYRDEARPRAGLIRVREFTMKDAYSFDADDAGADKSYRAMYDAYVRIFARVGLAAKPVEADTGDIGGNFSHEFMVFAASGEDGILDCPACGYAANQERAERAPAPVPYQTEAGAAETVATPGQHTCEEVACFLGRPIDQIVKSLVLLVGGKPVMALVPGDRELSETKLRRLFGGAKVEEAAPETVAQVAGPVGSIGPVGVSIPVYADRSLQGAADVVVGANQEGAHLLHVCLARDAKVAAYEDLATVRAGDLCPKCGKPLEIRRGTEVGQCFKLGTKYSAAMGASFLDEQGASKPLVMGCYGIGVSRTLQAIVEQSNDENGIIWPAAVAPCQVALLILDPDVPEVVAKAEALGAALEARGIDVFVDDRAERPGVKFKDADLIGLPIRVVAGAKGLAKGGFEIRRRTERDSAIVAPEQAAQAISDLLATTQK